MRKFQIGEKYYFNNGQVVILKIETDDFVLVKGDNNIHTEINGSNFCNSCNVGGISGVNISHTCGDADEIIEAVLDDISEEAIFWVNVKHLKNKPFEYKKWEKITEENNQLITEISSKNEILQSLNNEIENKEATLKDVSIRTDEKQLELYRLLDHMTSADKGKIIIENLPEIRLNASNISIPTPDILGFLKDSAYMRILEANGVDNWDGYGEDYSVPDCEDFEDLLLTRALEILARYQK